MIQTDVARVLNMPPSVCGNSFKDLIEVSFFSYSSLTFLCNCGLSYTLSINVIIQTWTRSSPQKTLELHSNSALQHSHKQRKKIKKINKLMVAYSQYSTIQTDLIRRYFHNLNEEWDSTVNYLFGAFKLQLGQILLILQ